MMVGSVARFPSASVAKRLKRLAGQLRRAVVTAVFPPRCQACGVILADAKGRFEDEHRLAVPLVPPGQPTGHWLAGAVRQVLGPWLCPDCLAGLEPLDGPVCTRCGTAFDSRQVADHVCGQCLEAKRPYDMARSVFFYNGVMRRLVHQLKFHDYIQLARPLGRLMHAFFLHVWKDRPVDAVVPVPLHIRRLRQRGFNQAWLLVRDGQVSHHASGEGPWRPEPRALVRTRWNRPQAGLDAGQRAANIRGAFAPGPAAAIAGRRILLVDDVMTTGSTVSECARVLNRAGAAAVDVLTLARA